jgi:3-oxoacyl-[acyl-carrier-protein] synthase-3
MTNPVRAFIEDIAEALPEAVETNDALLEGVPASQRELLMRHTGVLQRHIAAPGQTAADLGEQACRTLFARHPGLPERIDTLIFCTQSADYPLPPNSCVLHGRLGLRESVSAFDLSHACSGFVYAVQIARAMIASGVSRQILVVNADTYSRFIHPGDRSTRLLFGDGASATLIGSRNDGGGVLDTSCGTAGQYAEKIVVSAGGFREPVTDSIRAAEERDRNGNVRTRAHIRMEGRDVLSFASSVIPPHVNELLARNGLGVADVDWFVFHQASAVVLESLTRLLRADPAKVIRRLEMVGNTVSASIPLALASAIAEGRIGSGKLVLLCGFGAGLSWGSALLRW